MQRLRTADLFQRTDDGRGGWLSTASRRVHLHLHAWLHRGPMGQVARTLAHPELSRLIRNDPQLLLRPLRGYLWQGLGPRHRAQAFAAHFEWLLDALGGTAVDELYGRGALDVLEHALGRSRLTFALTPGHGLNREGELGLQLRLDGAALLHAQLGVVPTSLLGAEAKTLGQRSLVIGSLHTEHSAAAGLQSLARLTHSSRPKALLLAVLQGLCAGWCLGAPLGVSSRAQLHHRQRSAAQRFEMDYDELWLELGAKRRLHRHWLLPGAPESRADARLPSHKRTAHHHGSELRQALFAQGAQWASRVSAPQAPQYSSAAAGPPQGEARAPGATQGVPFVAPGGAAPQAEQGQHD
jgi:uncharacterized protein VirK/YbjX